MSTVYDATGAAERLHTINVDGRGAGRNAPGNCLRWQYFAVGATPNLTPARIAMDAWNHAPAEHRHPIPTDRPVPKDLIIVLGPLPGPRWAGDKNYAAGDVIVSNGTGIGLDTSVGATDWPSNGLIGNTTIRQRARQTGRPVLGYLTWWLGYPITVAGVTPAGAGPVTPVTTITLTPEEIMESRTIRIDRKPKYPYDAYLVNVDARTAMPIESDIQEDTLNNLGAKPVNGIQSPVILKNFQIVTGNFK